MREIKFRAWDRDKNNMLDPGYISLDGSGLQSYFNEAEELWYHNDIDIILLQYTGLKDKNGKEIYEGDILDRNDKLLCVVTFEDGKFGWNIRYKNPELNQRQDYFGRSYANQEEASKLEVIGNIYENPELLKVK